MKRILHTFHCTHKGVAREFQVSVHVEKNGKPHFSNFKILEFKEGKQRLVNFKLRQKKPTEPDILQTAKTTFNQSQGIK